MGLAFLACIVMQVPAVQTAIAGKVASSLDRKLGGKVRFSRIHFLPFNAISLDDVTVIDDDPFQPDEKLGLIPQDTVIYARKVFATMTFKGLFLKEGIHLGKVRVEDGMLFLANESKGVTNLKRVFSKGGSKAKDKDEAPYEGTVFEVRKVDVRNFRFRLVNYHKAMRGYERGKFPRAYGIDWCNLDLTADVKGKNLKYAGGYVTARAESLSAFEKSGYRIISITGDTKVGHGVAEITDLHIIDPWSDIRLPLFSMTGTIRDYGHFEQQVVLKGKIKDSKTAMKSISYFAPTLKENHLIFDIADADVNGPVSDLHVTDLRFKERLSSMSGLVGTTITGLPKAADLGLNARISNLDFDAKGAGEFISAWSKKGKMNLSSIPLKGRLNFKGTGKGPLNDLALDGTLMTPEGSARATAYLKHVLDKGTPVEVGGRIYTDNLDIGSITGKEMIGDCSAGASLRAVLYPGAPSVKIDSLRVNKLSLLGYDYSGIAATGTMSQGAFDGRIICNDPNLNFLFQGVFTPSTDAENALYKFYANIGYADLQALNLDKRGHVSRVSGQVNANYMRIKKADMIGDVNVTGLVLEDDAGRHDIGDITLRSHTNDEVNRINLQSSFADGSYVGNKPLSALIRDIQALTTVRDLPSLYSGKTPEYGGGQYTVKLDMHDSRDLLSFVKPGFYIADSTKLRLNVTSDGEVTANLVSPRIALGDKYLKRLEFNASNKEEHLLGTLIGEELRIGGMKFLDSELSLFADNDSVGAGFTYDNKTTERNQGEIYFTGVMDRSGDTLVVDTRLYPSNIYYEGNGWSLKGDNIRIAGKNITINGVLAECDDPRIALDGGFSPDRKDTLALSLERFDIGILNYVTGGELGLEGTLSGNAVLSSPSKPNPGLLMHFTCDSTRVAGHSAGVITLASDWDEDSSRYHAILSNDISGKNTLGADAFLNPGNGEIDATVSLDGFNLGYAQPVLKSVFSSLGGALSGDIGIHGKAGDLKISGKDTRFDNTTATVDFTNVPYVLNGPFSIDGAGVRFEKVGIKDRYHGKGEISGGIIFNKFKDIRLDTHIKMTDMEALDTDSGPSFHGNVFATGRVDITGPLDAIVLDVDAVTSKRGEFHLAVSGKGNAARSDLLTFKEEDKYVYVDPYDLMMNRIRTHEKKRNDMAVKLRVRATPAVQAVLDVSSDQDSNLTGRGSGDISLLVRPSRKEFSINGDYTLQEGIFHFNALGLAYRNFSISNGSSIRFTGDVMQSLLDMKATYSTKTNISTLIADTTSVASRKTVNCGISITGRLSNPLIRFTIDVPDLDPTTQARVESALNTEDKVQKQFLSLLLSGGFLPDEQSGIVNNNNMLYSNVADIMASQLNNILEKLDIPLDFGLNYQEMDSGNDIFDVAVSTQLFNNRVLVNGTLGNRRYTRNSGSAEVVGDIDVEIKLDRSGALRLTLFSHSADDYTNYLDNLQRNGVGIAYQREFNNFKTFIRQLFMGRNRRRNEAIRAAEMPPREKTVIVVEKEEEIENE